MAVEDLRFDSAFGLAQNINFSSLFSACRINLMLKTPTLLNDSAVLIHRRGKPIKLMRCNVKKKIPLVLLMRDHVKFIEMHQSNRAAQLFSVSTWILFPTNSYFLDSTHVRTARLHVRHWPV